MTAAAAVVTVALYARDLSKPQADFTLAVVALTGTALALLMAWGAWASRKNLKRSIRRARWRPPLPGLPISQPAEAVIATKAQ